MLDFARSGSAIHGFVRVRQLFEVVVVGMLLCGCICLGAYVFCPSNSLHDHQFELSC